VSSLTDFQNSDCTGQAYTPGVDFIPNVGGGYDPGVKTELLATGSSTYGKVGDDAQAQTITVGSELSYDGGTTGTFICNSFTPYSYNEYLVTPVSLPFSTPIEIPFKFSN
jgi:hypothetical protein